MSTKITIEFDDQESMLVAQGLLLLILSPDTPRSVAVEIAALSGKLREAVIAQVPAEELRRRPSEANPRMN